MANGKIPNIAVKTTNHTFNDLTQYSTYEYYLTIGNIHSALGVPSTARLVSVSLAGWAGLGATPNVQLASDDAIFVFFASGRTPTNTSYVTVRFAYV